MSFYHVLTSNVAPKTFPNNSPSNFSTPIYNPYDLNGKWEVAVTQMTHNNCVYTFNGEQYVIEDSVVDKDDLAHLDGHFKVDLKFSKQTLPRDEFFTEFVENVASHTLLKLIFEVEKFTWSLQYKILHPEFFVLLSRDLQRACQFMSTVLTSHDSLNRSASKPPDNITVTDTSIIVGKKTFNAVHYQLKERNAEMSIQDLMKIYNEKMPSSITTMSWHDSKEYIHLNKLSDDGTILILNEGLQDFLKLIIAGYSLSDNTLISINLRSKDYTLPWTVSLIRIKNPEPFKVSIAIHNLARKQFTTRSEACHYLNSLNNRVTFSVDDQNVTKMKIHGKRVVVKFDDDLRDILAFDKNEYEGPNTFTASSTFSLTRRIHYLYVYCNINELIRIGDTQAPLIAILPYDDSVCVQHIERVFKNPMYVSLIRNNIAQIDIEIRDDAGQLIPFTEGALTSIRLHFRQLYANL